MKRKIFILVSVMAMALALAACGKQAEKPQESSQSVQESEKETDLFESSESSEEVDVPSDSESEEASKDEESLSKYEKIASDFMDAVMAEDYETAYEMLLIKDGHFLKVEDFSWYLPRTSLADFVGESKEMTGHSEEKSGDGRMVTLQYGIDEAQLKVALDDDNNMKVDMNEWYYTTWDVNLPKGINDATINGASIEGYEHAKSGHFTTYRIPEIPKRAVQVEYTTEFGKASGEVTPFSADDENPSVLWTIGNITDDAVKEKTYNDFLALLNNLQKVYNDGGTAADMSKYMASSSANEFVNTVYDQIDKAATWNGKKVITFSFVGDYTKDGFRNHIVPVENNVLRITFYATKAWDGTSQNTFGQVYVTYEDGEMKLLGLENDTFLSDSNDWTQRW